MKAQKTESNQAMAPVVTVRGLRVMVLTGQADVARFDALLADEHWLGASRSVGRFRRCWPKRLPILRHMPARVVGHRVGSRLGSAPVARTNVQAPPSENTVSSFAHTKSNTFRRRLASQPSVVTGVASRSDAATAAVVSAKGKDHGL